MPRRDRRGRSRVHHLIFPEEEEPIIQAHRFTSDAAVRVAPDIEVQSSSDSDFELTPFVDKPSYGQINRQSSSTSVFKTSGTSAVQKKTPQLKQNNSSQLIRTDSARAAQPSTSNAREKNVEPKKKKIPFPLKKPSHSDVICLVSSSSDQDSADEIIHSVKKRQNTGTRKKAVVTSDDDFETLPEASVKSSHLSVANIKGQTTTSASDVSESSSPEKEGRWSFLQKNSVQPMKIQLKNSPNIPQPLRALMNAGESSESEEEMDTEIGKVHDGINEGVINDTDDEETQDPNMVIEETTDEEQTNGGIKASHIRSMDNSEGKHPGGLQWRKRQEPISSSEDEDWLIKPTQVPKTTRRFPSSSSVGNSSENIYTARSILSSRKNSDIKVKKNPTPTKVNKRRTPTKVSKLTPPKGNLKITDMFQGQKLNPVPSQSVGTKRALIQNFNAPIHTDIERKSSVEGATSKQLNSSKASTKPFDFADNSDSDEYVPSTQIFSRVRKNFGQANICSPSKRLKRDSPSPPPEKTAEKPSCKIQCDNKSAISTIESKPSVTRVCVDPFAFSDDEEWTTQFMEVSTEDDIMEISAPLKTTTPFSKGGNDVQRGKSDSSSEDLFDFEDKKPKSKATSAGSKDDCVPSHVSMSSDSDSGHKPGLTNGKKSTKPNVHKGKVTNEVRANFSFTQDNEVYVIDSDDNDEDIFVAFTQSYIDIPKDEPEEQDEKQDDSNSDSEVILIDPWETKDVIESILGEKVSVKEEPADPNESIYQTQKALQDALNTWSDDEYLTGCDIDAIVPETCHKNVNKVTEEKNKKEEPWPGNVADDIDDDEFLQHVTTIEDSQVIQEDDWMDTVPSKSKGTKENAVENNSELFTVHAPKKSSEAECAQRKVTYIPVDIEDDILNNVMDEVCDASKVNKELPNRTSLSNKKPHSLKRSNRDNVFDQPMNISDNESDFVRCGTSVQGSEPFQPCSSVAIEDVTKTKGIVKLSNKPQNASVKLMKKTNIEPSRVKTTAALPSPIIPSLTRSSFLANTTSTPIARSAEKGLVVLISGETLPDLSRETLPGTPVAPPVAKLFKKESEDMEGYAKTEIDEKMEAMSDAELASFLSNRFCEDSPEKEPSPPIQKAAPVNHTSTRNPFGVDLKSTLQSSSAIAKNLHGKLSAKSFYFSSRPAETVKISEKAGAPPSSQDISLSSKINERMKTASETKSKSEVTDSSLKKDPKGKSDKSKGRERSKSPSPSTKSKASSHSSKPRSSSSSKKEDPSKHGTESTSAPKKPSSSSIKTKSDSKKDSKSHKDSKQDPTKSHKENKPESKSHKETKPDSKSDKETKPDSKSDKETKPVSSKSLKDSKKASKKSPEESKQDSKSHKVPKQDSRQSKSSSSSSKTSKEPFDANKQKSVISPTDRIGMEAVPIVHPKAKESVKDVVKRMRSAAAVESSRQKSADIYEIASKSSATDSAGWLSKQPKLDKPPVKKAEECPTIKAAGMSSAVAKFQERLKKKQLEQVIGSVKGKKKSKRAVHEDFPPTTSMTQSIVSAKDQMYERVKKAKEERATAKKMEEDKIRKAKAQAEKEAREKAAKAAEVKAKEKEEAARLKALMKSTEERLLSNKENQKKEQPPAAKKPSSLVMDTINDLRLALSQRDPAEAMPARPAPAPAPAAPQPSKKARVPQPATNDLPDYMKDDGVLEMLSDMPEMPTCDVAKNFTPDDILFVLLQWIPQWLQEVAKQGDNSEAPPLLNKAVPWLLPSATLWPVPDVFDTTKEYVEIMLGHVIHEIWASVFADWKGYNKKKMSMIPVQRSQGDGTKFHSFIFQGLIQNNDRNPMCESDLVIVNLKVTKNNRPPVILTPVFGYVEETKRYRPRNPNEIHEKLGNVDSVCRSRRMVFTAKIKMHYKPICPSIDFTEIQVVSSLTSVLREISGLVAFQRNPLCHHLIQPKVPRIFAPVEKPIPEEYTAIHNESQARALSVVSDALLQPYVRPRVCLIQGPPGTGKSHTILSIIRETVFKKTLDGMNTCLLLCAPSNAAIDELVRRISMENDIREDKGADMIRLVRIGVFDSMNETSQAYSLDTKLAEAWANKRLKKMCANMPMSVKREILDIHNRLPKLQKKLTAAQKASCGAEIRKLQEEIKVLEAKRSNFDKTGQKDPTFRELQQLRLEVLAHAHVVCSTLNSAGSRLLHQAFLLGQNQAPNPNTKTTRLRFTGVLIDEACQSVEVEAIIPLQFGSSKLVLIGDPRQLPPTVISKKAETMKYSQSLFERLFNHFRNVNLNVVCMLDTQYRMHPDVVNFPSKLVYEGRLKTDQTVAQKRSKFPFKHYVLFDLLYGREQFDPRSMSFANPMEVQFIISLITCLMHGNKVKPQVIGIITPYKKQKFLLTNQLRQCQLDQISVGTVDGFQGQEKDVIIVSCVRANTGTDSIGFVRDKRRMNVALTRAKYSCYVVGHMETLMVDENWSKLVKDGRQRNCVAAIPRAGESEALIVRTIPKQPQPPNKQPQAAAARLT